METARSSKFEDDARIYEYTSAANPDVIQVPIAFHDASLHENGETRIVPFDLSCEMKVDTPATSPNLMASFVRICSGEIIDTLATATSQVFYIIRGTGSTKSEHGEMTWSQGDLFVVPASVRSMTHQALTDTAIYWVHDMPLLTYLGVSPSTKRFEMTVFRSERMIAEVTHLLNEPDCKQKNRLGILLGNKATENTTKTLTHTMWSLLNVLPAGEVQRPHRHNSVALDLCTYAESAEGKVYTLMGRELDDRGWVKDPVKCVWKTGTVFTTPPGWW